jgi:hypothetical protein
MNKKRILFLIIVALLLVPALIEMARACVDCDLNKDVFKKTSVVEVDTGLETFKVTTDENVMSQKVKDRWVTPDGQWCFVTVVIKQEDDRIIKKEELHCADTKFGITKNEEIEKLKKEIELEKARKPGYWELFAEFYYRDVNAPLYCRKYAKPDSLFKRPGTVCLKPTGEWEIIR